MIKQDKFWNSYYKKKRTPKISSKFAKFIFKNFLKKERHEFSLFDVGCGNGRDTFFFLQKKINCIGIDKSQIAISKNKDKNKKYNKNFINADFSLFLFDEHTKKKFSIYSRFTLHTLNQKEENQFIKKIYNSKKIKYLFIETRTINDDLYGVGKKIAKHQFWTNHYRRFIDPKVIKKKLEKKFKIIFFNEKKNYANFKKQNPKVLRIVCEKK
jgi:SAM-dependent methyltransferase